MRRFALVVGLVAILAPTALAANSKPIPKAPVVKVTGEIKALGLDRVTVGRVSCTLGARAASVARFVISDPVSITCKSGLLQAIRYAPAPAAPSREGAVTVTPTPRPSGTGSTNGATIAVSTGSIVFGAQGVVAPTSTTTASARGPITAVDATSLTVGDVTCRFVTGPILDRLLALKQSGAVVSLSCKVSSAGSSSLGYTMTGGAL